MATYRYTAWARAGSSTSATIDAPDRASAVRELVRRGLTPVHVETVDLGLQDAEAGLTRRSATPGPLGAPSASDAGRRSAAPGSASIASWVAERARSRAMSAAELASFVRELSTALDAGLPMVQAMRTLSRQGVRPSQRRLLEHVIAEVERGRTLGDAAAAWGRPFSELVISMFRAGESSGELGKVLGQAADLLEKDLRLRRQVTSAMVYPAILMVLILGSIAVILTVVVPRILAQLGQGVELPAPTRLLLAATGFARAWWPALLAAGALCFVAWRRVRGDARGRLATDRLALRVPLVGRVLRDVAVARFTRTLGTLTSAGLPILTSLRVTKATLGNRAMEAVIEDVTEKVSAGRTIAEPMEKSGYFPPMLVQIVNLGERSGRLDEMLLRAADAFEERSETTISMAMEALKPMLVVVMAGIVGLVILAILLPIIQMQESLFAQ